MAAAFRLPGAAVVVAEAAEAVAVAEAAEAAAVAAAVAARRGELAGFAKPGSFLTALTNTTRHGRVRLRRPGQFVCSPLYRLRASVLIRA